MKNQICYIYLNYVFILNYNYVPTTVKRFLFVCLTLMLARRVLIETMLTLQFYSPVINKVACGHKILQKCVSVSMCFFTTEALHSIR